MPDAADNFLSLAGQGGLRARALSTASGGACVASVRGVQVTVRTAVGLTVNVGDTLLIQRFGSTYYAVGIAAAAPVVPPTPPPPATDSPDTGDSAPPPKPTVTTGKLIVQPVATGSFRDGSWRSDIGPVNSADTYQGRYGGSSYGRSTGCAFYGSKPRTLSGATVTKATVKLRRLTSGDYGKHAPTLRLVSQSTRPGGAPTLNESTTGPSLGVINQVSPWDSTFTLPSSWAQAMVDGTRGGLAISIGSDTPYIRLAGRGSWSAAWTLTIYWKRG